MAVPTPSTAELARGDRPPSPRLSGQAVDRPAMKPSPRDDTSRQNSGGRDESSIELLRRGPWRLPCNAGAGEVHSRIQHRREAGAPTGDARLADQRLRVPRRNDPDHRRNVRADQGKILDLTTPAISDYFFRSAMPVSFNARVCCCCTEARGTPGVRVDDALL